LAFFRCSIALPNNVEISNEEEKHPLAFSIIAHGDARQLELLLASIYRPFNHYCLFIDPRADPLFKETIEMIVSCYKQHFKVDSIFLAKNAHPVHWGHISILNADLACMEQLLGRPGWKTMINLAGSEALRVSNFELARVGKEMKKPLVRSFKTSSSRFLRDHRYSWQLSDDPQFDFNTSLAKPIIRTKKIRSPPPFQLKVVLVCFRQDH